MLENDGKCDGFILIPSTLYSIKKGNVDLKRRRSHVIPSRSSSVVARETLRLSIRPPSARNASSGSTEQDTLTSSTAETTTPPRRKEDLGRDVIAQCRAFGGNLKRIRTEGEDDDSFLAAMSVPTFAAFPSSYSTDHKEHKSSEDGNQSTSSHPKPTRLGLEGLVPGSFLLHDALSTSDCEEIIHLCKNKLKFGTYRAGKNNHGAMQILVTSDAADRIAQILCRHIDPNSVLIVGQEGVTDACERHYIVGINRRWRVYRYEPGGEETFAPHIDAGFPPSGISDDGKTLLWDATPPTNVNKDKEQNSEIVSRLTILMYLNDDFVGGHTKFYIPVSMSSSNSKIEVIASIQPKAGSILVFPQAVGEDAVEYARQHWPLHEGSPVTSGKRPKYVIRSDVLFATDHSEETLYKNIDDPLFRYDKVVRDTFLPTSSVFDKTFLNHLSSLYNPHMGIENLGPLLYSFIRFTKVRKVVEIGAGYTSLWILQALKDNDHEMDRIRALQRDGKCRLMDWPWTVPHVVETYDTEPASLLCIDNCLHQRQTATGAAGVSKTLGLDHYFEFIQGDAFDLTLEPSSVDLLWCDFGVGSRIKDFVAGSSGGGGGGDAWSSIRPGGFLICHSTLTNYHTREWVEAMRARKGEDITGVPSDEYVEISLLEPHKHYQNSVSIFQRRKGLDGSAYTEPLYSEYA